MFRSIRRAFRRGHLGYRPNGLTDEKGNPQYSLYRLSKRGRYIPYKGYL